MVRKLRGKPPKHAKPRKAQMLIFGDAGVGKTWTSLDFPDCYYIDTENGASRDHYTDKLEASGAMYFGPPESQDFPSVLEEIQTLAMTRHDRKTLIVDSYSQLMIRAIALEEERLLSAGKKVEFGSDKRPAVRMSRRLVSWLDRLDMNVILTAHEKALWQNGEQVGFTYDGWDKIKYSLDLTLRIVKHGSNRRAIVVKSRLEAFPEGSQFDWNYAEFAKLYGVDRITADVEPLEQASEAQVGRIRSLLDSVKVEPDWTIKCLEKAGVDSWADMDSNTIGKCIAFLENRVS